MPRLIAAGGSVGFSELVATATNVASQFPVPHVMKKCDDHIGIFAGSGEGAIVEHEAGLLLLDGIIWSETSTDKACYQLIDDILTVGVEKAFALVSGDFACVWMQRDSRTVYLARDRFGKRPLYYCKVKNRGWIVASQPGALLRAEGVSKEINLDFAVRYGALHYRMIDNRLDESPYKAIHQVAPGQIVEIQPYLRFTSSHFWKLSRDSEYEGESESQLADEYRSLLRRSVESRLKRVHRPIFSISGGMDSSSVLANAVRIAGKKQPAVSSLYEDHTFDERAEISDMTEGFVSNWYQVELPNQLDIVSEVDELIALNDEPVATATWLSHRRICQVAAEKGYLTMFGGLGGDELNAGEYEYFPYFFADLARGREISTLENEVEAWSRLHDHPVFQKTPAIAADLVKRLTDINSPGVNRVDHERTYRYVSVLSEDLATSLDFSPIVETVFSSHLKNRMWQDMSRETLPCCLRAEDRHSSHFQLTAVSPFLDNDLVDFMFRVPSSLKIRNGITKYLLRVAMKGVLPEATRTRVKKTGWNAPAHLWFTGNGAAMLRDLVASDEFRRLNIYKSDEILRVIQQHEEIVRNGQVQENHMMFLWSFLNMMRWQTWLAKI